VGFVTGLRRSTRRIRTMPNNKCPKKDTIDKLANDALKEIGKIVTTDTQLTMHLDTVKEKLVQIAADHHHL
jgi:CheY-specific phosphatase CheX